MGRRQVEGKLRAKAVPSKLRDSLTYISEFLLSSFT